MSPLNQALARQALAKLRARFMSMSARSRLLTAVLVGVVLMSLGYLLAPGSNPPDEYLFGGEPLSPRQLDQVEAAIAQAGLSGHTRDEERIRVPAERKSEFLAAVAEARALPPNFHSLLENAVDNTSFLESREAQRERLKIARQQALAEIVRAMRWVEEAYVLYDEQQQGGLSRTTLATAVVSVMPRQGETLDAGRIKKLQNLVSHSIAGLKPENVNVISLGSDEPALAHAEPAAEPQETLSTQPAEEQTYEHPSLFAAGPIASATRREQSGRYSLARSNEEPEAAGSSAIWWAIALGTVLVTGGILAYVFVRRARTSERNRLAATRSGASDDADQFDNSVADVLEELALADSSLLQAVVDDVGLDVLALAMMTSDGVLSRRVARGLGKPAAAEFRRQLQQHGPTRLSDVEAAQRAVVHAVEQHRQTDPARTAALAA